MYVILTLRITTRHATWKLSPSATKKMLIHDVSPNLTAEPLGGIKTQRGLATLGTVSSRLIGVVGEVEATFT